MKVTPNAESLDAASTTSPLEEMAYQIPMRDGRPVMSSQRQRRPTDVLMDSSYDRPDVATIAVLGYN